MVQAPSQASPHRPNAPRSVPSDPASEADPAPRRDSASGRLNLGCGWSISIPAPFGVSANEKKGQDGGRSLSPPPPISANGWGRRRGRTGRAWQAESADLHPGSTAQILRLGSGLLFSGLSGSTARAPASWAPPPGSAARTLAAPARCGSTGLGLARALRAPACDGRGHAAWRWRKRGSGSSRA